jgi:hypothetical protein
MTVHSEPLSTFIHVALNFSSFDFFDYFRQNEKFSFVMSLSCGSPASLRCPNPNFRAFRLQSSQSTSVRAVSAGIGNQKIVKTKREGSLAARSLTWALSKSCVIHRNEVSC